MVEWPSARDPWLPSAPESQRAQGPHPTAISCVGSRVSTFTPLNQASKLCCSRKPEHVASASHSSAYPRVKQNRPSDLQSCCFRLCSSLFMLESCSCNTYGLPSSKLSPMGSQRQATPSPSENMATRIEQETLSNCLMDMMSDSSWKLTVSSSRVRLWRDPAGRSSSEGYT